MDEASGPDWDAALAALVRGDPIQWRSMTLRLSGDGLSVRVKTEWEPAHVSRARAEIELMQARGAVAELAGESKELTELIAGSSASYTLVADEASLASWSNAGFEYFGPRASNA